MRVESFAEIADEFHARIARIAWATVATVGADGAPRTRILHPIWEGHVGWIATTSNSPKIRHLSQEPRVSLTYWDAQQDDVHVEACATVAPDQADRDRIWDLFAKTEPPLGYDPALFWPSSSDSLCVASARPHPDRVDWPAAPRVRAATVDLAPIDGRLGWAVGGRV